MIIKLIKYYMKPVFITRKKIYLKSHKEYAETYVRDFTGNSLLEYEAKYTTNFKFLYFLIKNFRVSDNNALWNLYFNIHLRSDIDMKKSLMSAIIQYHPVDSKLEAIIKDKYDLHELTRMSPNPYNW